MLNSPEVDGTEVAQAPLDDALPAAALDPDAAAAPAEAVVLADCVESLLRSPGNCTAVCGFTEGAAPTVVVEGDAPVEVSVEPSADEVGRVRGSEPVAAVAAPLLPGLLCVAFVEVPVTLVGDVPVVPVVPDPFDGAFVGDDVIPLSGEAVAVLVWACAAPDAASHRMVAKMNGRRIALSLSFRRAKRAAIGPVPRCRGVHATLL